MTEPFPHHNEIVEKFWDENPELKFRIFQSWYLKDDVYPVVNDEGKEAVSRFIGKGAITAARKAWADNDK